MRKLATTLCIEAMPAAILLALLNATQPALASGQVPYCTERGVEWIDAQTGQPIGSGEDNNRTTSACAHGWCKSRRVKPVNSAD